MFRRIVASLCLFPLAALATAPTITDWGDALRKDAQALHDDLAANHPGPVDPLNPGFAVANDKGLALALDRAKQTHDYAGYFFEYLSYASTFNDGHLGVRTEGPGVPPLPNRWPGFLTAYDHTGAQRVVTRSDDAPVPLGARLVSCDGRPADRLAEEIVGSQYGRWQLRSQQVWRGGALFLDNGNPWVERPARCVFDVDGKQQTVALDWKPLDEAAAKERLAATYRRQRDPIGMRTFPDGTVWITLSDFDGATDGAAAKALEPLIARLQKERRTIVDAPRIVLDLRANNGGSSDWSQQVAKAIWGEARVDDANKTPITVDWRASTANIASIRAYGEALRKAPGSSKEMMDWVNSVADGMTKARDEGKPFWRAPNDDDTPSKAHPLPAPKARVFMVTDSGCASACLDAADVWLARGAIHGGEETSADTLYMDIRVATLPSGIGRLGAAMKVYRGRKRGNNVPLVPAHAYDGNLADTAALEHWIATLPR